MIKHDLKDKFNQVFATDDGQIVLREIMRISGFENTVFRLSSVDPNALTSFVAEGRRQIYLEIRQALNKNTLKGVEHGNRK